MGHKDKEEKNFPPSSLTGSQSLCREVPAAAPSQAAESHLSVSQDSVSQVFISTAKKLLHVCSI